MKKLLLLSIVASLAFAGSASAQKNSKKNCDKDRSNNKSYSKKQDRSRDDNYGYNNRDDDRRDNNAVYASNKYNGNAPRKVRDAFSRDYPNAQNVSWTKDRGVWTAQFKRSGLFGGNTSVSYAANGQRVNNGNSVYNNNNNRTARGTEPQRRKTVFEN